jgi:TonB family protein
MSAAPDEHSSPPPEMTGSVYRSELVAERSIGTSGFVVAAVALHAAAFLSALYLPKLLGHSVELRKPVIAHLVALGKPRKKGNLPHKEQPPPPAATTAPPSVPSAKPEPPSAKSRMTTRKPAPKQPSRQDLMERALAMASGQSDVAARRQEEKPVEPVEREGTAEGSPQGTAATAEIGDKYFSAVHEAILANYIVPSVISERERLFLKATLVARIGGDGALIDYKVVKPSGNDLFDAALELAVKKTKLPPPPPEIAQSLRTDGVELNFKP